MTAGTVKEFIYWFSGGSRSVTVPVHIPFSAGIREFAFHLLNVHNLPCYLGQDMTGKLGEFVTKETDEWHRQMSSERLETFCRNLENVDSLVDMWARAFREEHAAYSRLEDITDEEIFSKLYHSLVHSADADLLLKQEQDFAKDMGLKVRNKDLDRQQLESRQSKEMEVAIGQVGISATDDHVNNLAAKHFEDVQMLESKWASEITALRESQSRTFQNWLMNAHEELKTFGKIRTLRGAREVLPEPSNKWPSHANRLEESFTIHLGAQLKQMHNLRLLSADTLEICNFNPRATSETMEPQRLQTAMGLYSNQLRGMVLLVDNRVNSYTGIKRDFANVCQKATEFHFDDIEDQLEKVRNLIPRVVKWRTRNATHTEGSRSSSLRPGDVYITRHSNLADVHVVFQVICDDSLHLAEVSSRHPVILALRNVIKVACFCDVTTLTIPLLLAHEMSEEMTMSWCLKRAELVYKCVKGFMIEMASWGGAECRTVQFLVPKGISEELFANLSTMLPSIFRMSNPLVVKSI